MSNPEIHIFLDLDGVMADFDRHAREQGKYTADGKMKWDELDYQWWSTMPACDGAKEFYDAVKAMAVVRFLTAPVLHEECFSGKAAWVQKFVPADGKRMMKQVIICPSADKHYLARPNHVLIDDRENNVKEWIAAGGIGIHHTGDFAETMRKLQAVMPVQVQVKQPRLIAVGGMSGSGKTTLAAALAQNIPDAVHLDSDRTRKEIFGVSETTRLPPEAYSAEATKRLIAEMDGRVKKFLAAGKTAIVSATFLSDKTRAQQESLAQTNNAQFIGLWLEADLQVLFDRVAKRVDNPSDAGVDIVQRQKNNAPSAASWSKINATQPAEDVVKEALKVIQGVQKKPGDARPAGPTAAG